MSVVKRTGGEWSSGSSVFFLVCVKGSGSTGGQISMIPETKLTSGEWSSEETGSERGEQERILIPEGGCRDVLFPFDQLGDWLDDHTVNRLLIDSGAFALASSVSKQLPGVAIGQVFGMHLEDVPDGEATLASYERTIREWESKCWGYVEFDIGHRDDRRQRREEQESRGIRPIPVYSALNDPLDYFEELLDTYDRVCVGSIARLARSHKIRLLSVVEGVYRSSAKKPWIHLLGCAPGPSTMWAHSMDASNWAHLSMFGAEEKEKCVGGWVKLPHSFNDAPRMSDYEDRREWALARRAKCYRACASRAVVNGHSWFAHNEELISTIATDE